MIWSGRVEDGQGRCCQVCPFPDGWFQGSLNLRGDWSLTDRLVHLPPKSWQRVRWMPTVVPARMETGDGFLNVIIGVDPTTDLTEVAATVHLRSEYSLSNGDLVTLHIDDRYVVDGEVDHVAARLAARRKPARTSKRSQKFVQGAD